MKLFINPWSFYSRVICSRIEDWFCRKGLSRYYEGKSQSFACMSEVRCLEDLRKKDNPYKQKIKSCKSYVALGGMMAKKQPASSSCANLDLVAANGFRTPPIRNGYHQ